MSRRDFLATAGTAGALAMTAVNATAQASGPRDHRAPKRLTLKVQPVLIYHLPQRREQTSWRGWGGLHTREDVAEEVTRINKELGQIEAEADFPVEFLPLAECESAEQGAKIAKGDHDVLLMYGASNGGNVLEALTDPNKWTVLFLRHKSGPVYLWYEITHNRYLRKTVDQYGQPGMTPRDVVVDSLDEVTWRLRALHGLKNTMGKRIVAIGGPSGWGKGGQKAPQLAKDIWGMEIVPVEYPELGERIQKARADGALVKYCNHLNDQYLKDSGLSLETGRGFMANAFVLNEVFKDLMDEADTDAITVNHCMGTIMPMSETTACMPLSFLNDEGYLAFCESDFVVIPSGVLLHYISGKPVFLNDPTYPHDNLVTLAHCTAPRKMDGEHLEPARILTHFESDYGAAPKVEMKLGEKMTVIDPDFDGKRWVAFEGEIVDNPFLDICRSQIDVHINGDTDTLNRETVGFHWMASYGNYLKETGYAVQKTGMEWMNLTKA